MLADRVLARMKSRPGVNAQFVKLSPEGEAICAEIESWLAVRQTVDNIARSGITHTLDRLNQRSLEDIPVKQR